jgi:DNA-binding transcriptional ArsR family regulator
MKQANRDGAGGPRPERGADAWRDMHKALSDPLRLRLLEALWARPQSARELAPSTGLPPDRLYYHLGQLERAGLAEIAGYRQLAGGKVERVYARAAVEPPGDAATPAEAAAFLGSVLEATQADIATAFLAKEAGQHREVDIRRGAVRLTNEALAELRAQIGALARRFGTAGDGGQAEGTWTRVVLALIDLEDRPGPVAREDTHPVPEGAPL